MLSCLCIVCFSDWFCFTARYIHTTRQRQGQGQAWGRHSVCMVALYHQVRGLSVHKIIWYVFHSLTVVHCVLYTVFCTECNAMQCNAMQCNFNWQLINLIILYTLLIFNTSFFNVHIGRVSVFWLPGMNMHVQRSTIIELDWIENWTEHWIIL